MQDLVLKNTVVDSANPVVLVLPEPMERLKKLEMRLNNPLQTQSLMPLINSPTSNSKMVKPPLLVLVNLVPASPSVPRLLPPLLLSTENLPNNLLRVMPRLPPPLPENVSLVLPVVEVLLLVNLRRLSVSFRTSFLSILACSDSFLCTSSVFVGNLPFSVTNESLAATFEGCKVKTATVVTRKFGQAAGRSKGFAFVDFESEEDQQKALNEYQGKELEGRALSLKVAIEADQQQQQGGGEEQAGADSEDKGKDGDNEPEATIVAS